MALSLEKIEKQIAALERQREAIRQGEVKEVVDRIKVAIAHYNLTPAQLFGSGKLARKTATAGPSSSSTSATTAAKYADDKGNVWAGRGPRPHWLRVAINAGAKLESFHHADAAGTEPIAPVKPRKKKAKTQRAPSTTVYASGDGKS